MAREIYTSLHDMGLTGGIETSAISATQRELYSFQDSFEELIEISNGQIVKITPGENTLEFQNKFTNQHFGEHQALVTCAFQAACNYLESPSIQYSTFTQHEEFRKFRAEIGKHYLNLAFIVEGDRFRTSNITGFLSSIPFAKCYYSDPNILRDYNKYRNLLVSDHTDQDKSQGYPSYSRISLYTSMEFKEKSHIIKGITDLARRVAANLSNL
jgi:hypothetical protein